MFKKVELSTLALLIIFALYCALAIGSSWDEPYEMNIGKDRLKYLMSFGSYKYFEFHKYTEFYPALYNTLAIFITKIFPNKYEIEIWHLTNTFFSILSIFGIYKITSNLFNKQIGKIVFLLCFINPIFFGHMAMNSKDTIIVFANVWSTYIFLRYLKKQNIKKNRNRYVLLAGLTIGFGTGVRLPFITTLFPLIIFALVDMFFFKTITSNKFSIKKFLIDLIKVLTISYFVAISAWPQVHSNIFIEPFKIFVEQIKFQSFGVNWILLNGIFFDTLSLPKSYIFTNFFYKSPEFILLCFLVFGYFLIVDKKFYIKNFNYFWSKIFLILFIFLFPSLFFIFLTYRVYDGLRLFLYLIPYFNIIPALGIYYLFYNFNSIKLKFLSGILACSFFYYIFIFVTLTPYQYTYLNIFVGNYSSAYNKFENDYWAISIKELINKIPNETTLTTRNKKNKIAFCGVPHNLSKMELNKISNFKYEQKDLYDNEVEYIIMTNRIEKSNTNNTLANVKTCFEKFKGDDLIVVERNGLKLSTLRKKN